MRKENLEYATNKVDTKTNKRKSFGTIVRVDLGLYSNKALILWKRKANMEIQIVTYDFKEMKKRLSIEHKIIDFSNVNINTNAYTCFKGRKFVSPNGSMQGIDIYGSDIYKFWRSVQKYEIMFVQAKSFKEKDNWYEG